MYNFGETMGRRRAILVAIFLSTLPCYCLGWLAWTLTPKKMTPTPTSVLTLSATSTIAPSVTPLLIVTVGGQSPTPLLLPATLTFTPSPTVSPTSSPTAEPSWTPFLPPTATYTPTWTPVPPTVTFTPSPIPATQTPVPLATTSLPPSPSSTVTP